MLIPFIKQMLVLRRKAKAELDPSTIDLDQKQRESHGIKMYQSVSRMARRPK